SLQRGLQDVMGGLSPPKPPLDAGPDPDSRSLSPSRKRQSHHQRERQRSGSLRSLSQVCPTRCESRPGGTRRRMILWSVRGAVESTAHCTAAEGEQCMDLGHFDIELDIIDFTEEIYVERDLMYFYGNIFEDMPSLPPSFELSACLDFPPTFPLLSPLIVPAASVPPPLSPDSHAGHPHPTMCAVGSPRVWQSLSASSLEEPLSLPPASESWTPPWPSDPAAPSRLHWAPSGSALVGCRPTIAIASGLHSSTLLLFPFKNIRL
ncbi:hypothetical protein M9458_045655, partial [Cirrhinus mrigala]